MAFDFNGNGYCERDTALPTDANTFTACGWARIDASNTNPGCIFEIHLPDTSQHFFGSKAGSSTDIACFLNYGTQSKTDFSWNPGSGNWFFWSLVNSGGTFTVRCAAQSSSAWDLEYTFGSATSSFTPNRVAIGGNLYTGDEHFNGAIGIVKVWNAALTGSELLAQKSQIGPVTTSNLLSSHQTEGPDVATDQVANAGGTDADWDLMNSGTGTTYVANPSITAPNTLTASGLIVPVQVDSVTLNPTAPAVAKGSTLGVTATVLGSDGLPFEGISVALTSATTSRVTVVSSPVVTDAAGESDFTLNGVEVGTSVLTANADSGGATTTATATVSPVTSVAVIQVLEPLVVEAGESISVSVYATGTDGLPISGVSVTLASGTTGVATVASSPQNTAVSGIATFVLNGIAAGNSTLTATAASGAVVDTAIATVTAVAPPQPAGAQGSAWGRWIRGM